MKELAAKAKAMPGAELAGKTDASEVENAIGKMLTDKTSGPTKMKAFVKNLDPDALAGAQKAAADWIGRKVLNVGEAGTSGGKELSFATMDKLMRDNLPTLKVLLPEKSINTLQAVRANLERDNRTITASKNKGKSDTAKDQHGVLEKIAGSVAGHTGAGMSVALIEGIQHLAEHGLTSHTAAVGAAGALAWGGVKLAERESSIRKTLFTDALMNPDRARHYLQKAPLDGRGGPMKAIASSLRRQIITAPLLSARPDLMLGAPR